MRFSSVLSRQWFFRWFAIGFLCVNASHLLAEESQSNEDVFGGGFELDESSFVADFEETPATELTPAWLKSFKDHFTVRLSQQFYAQLVNHDDPNRSQADIENNRLNLLIKYQHAFAEGWYLQGSSQLKFFWPGDYEYGEYNDPVVTEFNLGNFAEFRVNDIYLQRSFTHHSFKLGRQQLVWGEVQSNSVLDVINIREFRDLSVIDIEDARLNQTMLVWEFFKHNMQWTNFVNLYPEFNPLPRKGSPLFIQPPFVIQELDREHYFFEAGSQLRWSVGASDFSIVAAYLYENSLHFKPSPTQTKSLESVANDYWLVGGSLNRAIGKWLLKFDAVFKKSVLADTISSQQVIGFLQKDQLGASIGFEYTIDDNQYIMASVAGLYFINPDQGLAPQTRLMNKDLNDRWRLLYNRELLNKSLNLNVLMIGSIQAKNILSSVALDYSIDDYWSVATQLIYTAAASESTSARLNQDVRLGVNISYVF